MTVRAWVIGLAMMVTVGVSGRESVSIQASPTVSFAPATLIIRTRIEPDANNRAIEVVADAEGFYGSSTIPLEGDRAPKTTTFQFRSLPAGEDEVTASLIGTGGQRRALARTHVQVIGLASLP